jgi:hypothetical protein
LEKVNRGIFVGICPVNKERPSTITVCRIIAVFEKQGFVDYKETSSELFKMEV